MTPHRYVFVGGLHRSGTSLVARIVGGLPGVASIRGADVPEDEGAYLQGAIPHTARHGAPMHFAADPEQHLIEGCRWDRLEVRERMEADWAPWFGPGPWRVEKSPVNLVRTRLLQQLFPRAQFVLVLRHPQAVAAAVAKWVDRPAGALVDHWIEAHRVVAGDLPFLHAALVLRYEDLVARPDAVRRALAAFLSVPPEGAAEPVRDGNADYDLCAPLSAAQAGAIADWGYAPGGRVLGAPPALAVRHPLARVRAAVGDALGG